MPIKSLINYWSWIIGMLLFSMLVVWIEHAFGWLPIMDVWRQFSVREILTALILIFLSYIIRTMRIFSYFHRIMHGHFLSSLRLVLLHNFFNNILPMRSGEIAFPVLIRKYFSIPVIASIPALLWLRLLDLHFLFMLGSITLINGQLDSNLGILTLTFLSAIPLILFFLPRYLSGRIAGKNECFSQWLQKVRQGLPGSPAGFLISWIWTIANWTVKLIVFAWLLAKFTAASYDTALLGAIAGEFSSILPFHGFAGTGTYEAGVLAALIPQGIPFEAAIQGALNLHLFILGSTIISAVLAILIKPKIVAADSAGSKSRHIFQNV